MTPEQIRLILPPEMAEQLATDLEQSGQYGPASQGVVALRDYARRMRAEHPFDPSDVAHLIDAE